MGATDRCYLSEVVRSRTHKVDPAPPVRVLREVKGWTLSELAERAGVSRGHLSRYERGQRGISVSMLRRIVDALGLVDLESTLAPWDPYPFRPRSSSDAAVLARPAVLTHQFGVEGDAKDLDREQPRP